jgi:hypothetical protein
MNRFEVMRERLTERFQEKANVTIVYHRGSSSVTLTDVWPNMTLFKILERDNQRMEWSDRDYIIPVASLILNGSLTVPQKDDWIEETFPEGVRQFNVSAPDTEPVWRYDDIQRTVFRVHTKRVTA